MFTIGNDELENKENIGEFVGCDKCGGKHPVEYGDEVLPDGTKKPSRVLAFYTCGGKPYLAGIGGKRV